MTRFKQHLADVDETYFEHFNNATGFGIRMIFAGLACLIHGVFPFLFVSTGSRAIDTLHDRMVVNRLKPSARNAGRVAESASLKATTH